MVHLVIQKRDNANADKAFEVSNVNSNNVQRVSMVDHVIHQQENVFALLDFMATIVKVHASKDIMETPAKTNVLVRMVQSVIQ